MLEKIKKIKNHLTFGTKATILMVCLEYGCV